MFHRWFAQKKHTVVEKRLPNHAHSPSLAGNGVHFGCSWCPHPVGQVYVLLDVSDCTLPAKTHGFMVPDDLNP